MKYLYVLGGVVVGSVHVPDTQTGVVPSGPDGATEYTVADSAPAQVGWTCTIDASEAPTFAAPTAGYVPNLVSVPEFKLLFKMAEDAAIYTSTDTNVVRFRAFVDDSKTTIVDLNDPGVQERIDYLGTMPADASGVLPLPADRVAQIKAGNRPATTS